MGELGALFNPGMRHELEERRSKAMRREEEGNARDGDLRIDLESGVAVINAPGSAENGNPQREVTPALAELTGSEAPADDTADPGSSTDGEAPGPMPDAVQRQPWTAKGPAREAAAATEQSSTPALSDQPPGLRPRGKRGMAASAR